MKKNCLAAAVAALLLLAGLIPAYAVSATTTTVVLYIGKPTAFVNNEEVPLTAPPTVANGRTYMDPNFFVGRLPVSVKRDAKAKRIELQVAETSAVLNLTAKLARINGAMVPLGDLAITGPNGAILVQFAWMMKLLKLDYVYEPENGRITITYIIKPDGLIDRATGNSKPVAKFAFGKSTYRIGEPVEIFDYSYDADGEGIVAHEWTGKKDAYFKPGTYPVSLKVQDRKGNWSDVYTKSVTISAEPYVTQEQYPFYFQPPESAIQVDFDTLLEYKSVPSLTVTANADNTRPLLLSDSPETITQFGVLYRDTVDGKARLYAHHMNGMDENIKFAIVATNTSDHEVTVKTTNKGEVYPSIYAALLGHQATLDFQLQDKAEQQLVLPAGSTHFYSLMPDFAPGYGMNAIYDVETDGPVTFRFVAMHPADTLDDVANLPDLPYNNNVRGTFATSRLNWHVDMANMNGPSKLVIGDNSADKFVAGFDAVSQTERVNFGNYGVIYNIHAERPPKMAILLITRGGLYKGPIKINGRLVMVPKSGVLSPYDGLYLLARTDGAEKSLDIEFTPSAGSSLPVNLLFYPLKELD
ncbi:MAG TPA: stalk domain-containing protein [Bacilli bacterium]